MALRLFSLSFLILFTGCGVHFKDEENPVKINDLLVEGPTRLTSSFSPNQSLTSANLLIEKVYLKGTLVTNGISGTLTINELFVYPGGEIRTFLESDEAPPRTNGKSGGNLILKVGKIIFAQTKLGSSGVSPAQSSFRLLLTAQGQRGGQGRKGIKGRTGEKGPRGDSVNRVQLNNLGYCLDGPQKYRQIFGEKSYEVFVKNFPLRGKKGGIGYIGGPGFEGYRGGNSGLLQIHLPKEYENQIQIKILRGTGGRGGEGGDGGDGGDPGDTGEIITNPSDFTRIPECTFDVRGEQGEQGPQGAPGEPGADGQNEKSYINGREIR